MESYVVRIKANVYKIFDLGGSGHYRALWPIYCNDATHIMLVVDGTDRSRFFVIRDEIQ